MKAHSDFVHLHVHSQYSLLDGACQLDPLIEHAQRHKMPALALTDHGNLFGAVEFYQACMKGGIKPILGCEAYVAPDSRFEKSNRGISEASFHLILLARDEAGYRNLIKLVSLGYLEGFYYRPRIDKELLAKYGQGLMGLSGCLASEIPHLITAGQDAQARKVAGEFVEIFGTGNFYLELQDHRIPEQAKVNRVLREFAKDLDLPLVATNDLHYLERMDSKAHDALLCIQTGATLEDPKRLRFHNDEFYFKSPEEMFRVFAEVPEAVRRTVEIAEKSNIELDLSTPRLPQFTPPAEKTERQYLGELVTEGVARRYPAATETVRQRVAQELGIIEKTGFTSYFLIVWDFVRYAKSQGIPVGPGRGSAAGSVVSYCLGITDIDPLKYDLLFERFLNPERVSFPDIDIDFCYERRPEVISYVQQKYGQRSVAQIITFGTMMAKAVVRDVARVMGFSYPEADRIAKLIPFELGMTLTRALELVPELRQLYETDPRIGELIDTSMKLEGLTRHASTHAAGVVIADGDLTDTIPLSKTSDDQITTGYAMESLEKVGLLKMDFLGLRTLTVVDETVKIVKRTRGVELDWATVPLDDPATYRMLSHAESTGVFQLESSGMRDLLRKLKPDRFEDLIALLALFRPGPIGSGMLDDFIKRRHGQVKPSYDHPLLEPILQETYGILVYQEQVMRIVSTVAGFSLARADLLRRAMGKKNPEVMEQARADFVAGAVKTGLEPRIAEKIFEKIAYFAGYGFNKCVVGSTQIMDAETGDLVTVEALFRSRRPMVTLSVDENLRLVKRPILDVVANGPKRVFKVETRLGRTITVTDNHPFLTVDGWKELKELKPGDFLAAPRALAALTPQEMLEPHQLVTLAAVVSEGNTCHPSGVYVYNKAPDYIRDFLYHVRQFDLTEPTVRRRRGLYEVYAGTGRQTMFPKHHTPWNKGRFGYSRSGPQAVCSTVPKSGVRQWIEQLGLAWVKSTEKFIPEVVFRLPREQVALFLGRLWSGDGHLWTAHSRSPMPFYATSSERLAFQAQHLLLRLGIVGVVRRKQFTMTTGVYPGYVVGITGKAPILRFIELLGPSMVGQRGALRALKAHYELVRDDMTSRDVIPAGIKRMVRDAKDRIGMTWKQVEQRTGLSMKEFYGDLHVYKRGFRRSTIQRLGEFFESPDLLRYAASDVYWDRIQSIEPCGVKETYDLEIDGTHNFIANDLIVHNSHSAAYAVISYRTAFLKANYLAEFMTALLTSERENLDKIAQYIEESKRMGIQILPPDVNESFSKFTVVTATAIRFGLSAVKNVGQGAIDSIIRAREAGGRFTSLYEFCERVDLRQVNRKVLESLIRCGAFDSLGRHRSQLAAVVDRALDVANGTQRDRQAGQLSLFDSFQREGTFTQGAQEAPDIREWPEGQRLAYEKELLGFYVTGHPLARHERILKAYAACPIDKVGGLRDGAEVTLGGVLAKVKLTTTKKGNERMAILRLEDFSGGIEVLVFPKAFAACGKAITAEATVFVKGRLTLREEEPKLLANEILSLEDARQRFTEGITIRLFTAGLESATLEAIYRVLKEHAGKTPVALVFTTPERQTYRLEVEADCWVTPTEELFQALEDLLGQDVAAAVSS